MIAEHVTRSTCAYCGVGCQVNLHVNAAQQIFRVSAPQDAAPNYGRLCVKGRFGMDFVYHPSRLTTPLIRHDYADIQAGRARRGPLDLDGFRPLSWDAALDLVAQRLAAIKAQHGGDAIAALCSAKATNEDNYVFQKFMRQVLGTNNVDHCARLCHAGSVTGLQMAIGSSAMSNAIAEMPTLECFIVTGSNTTETHPVIATFLKQAVRKHGAHLIVADPRHIELADFAEVWLRQKPGTDVILWQALAHVIVREAWYDADFIRTRTEGFADYIESLERWTPAYAEEMTGVPAADIVKAARLYATANRAAIYWGMGISQSTHGTDNALALANLALMCGHLGAEGAGLNPLRGQNNVQGCSDAGGLFDMFPGYQRVDHPEIRAKFAWAWGAPLNPQPGLATPEMVDGAGSGALRAFYVMGENPLMSEPNLAHARHCLQNLDLIVCQDIFFNETCAYADIILPATSFAEKDGTFTNSDRRVQMVRAAIEPIGAARADWEIVCDLAGRVLHELHALGASPGSPMGNLPAAAPAAAADLALGALAGYAYDHPAAIWQEMARLTPPFQGISYARLEAEGGVHWPCPTPDHPGTPYLFAESFPRGRGKFHSLDFLQPHELPDADYPLILSTGRVLFHWHGGTMTRRSKLDDIYPEAVVEVHPEDARTLAVSSGAWVELKSRRGRIECKVLVTGRSPQGTVFLPFHFAEAAANELTLHDLDPLAKIPDYKVCAVRLTPLERPDGAVSGVSSPGARR
jgi:predicted molibdopterin-dependent oxidoreductase YjgC